MALGNTFGNSVINWARNVAFPTQIATPFASLHTADPGATGASEGTFDARIAIELDAPSPDKQTQNTNLETFTGLGAETYTYCGLWSLASGGVFIGGGALAASKTANAGDSAEFAVGALQFDLT